MFYQMRACGAEGFLWNDILQSGWRRRATRPRCWIFTRRTSRIRRSHLNTTCPRQRSLPRASRKHWRHHPYLVCERDGEPVGYAYAHRIRERAAYDWAAELSIYLAPAAQGQGVGTALYQCLTDLLVLQHLRVLYGCVTLPNGKSRRLHEKLGFSLVGVWHGSGWKRNGWHDVGWFEKRDRRVLHAAAGRRRSPGWTAKKYRHVCTRYTEKLNDGGLN